MAEMVSVVVVNWNGRAFLERCLASLSQQTYSPLEVILVDNGSTDDSLAWTAAHYPAVRLIRNERNRGFAAANNQGIQAGQGPYVALLNNDAWAEPDWVEQMVAALAEGPAVGMVAAQLVLAAQPDVIDSTGICVDRCGISWDRAGGQAAHAADAPRQLVFGPCAGAALYRRSMLVETGGFDEDFFMYLEDVDLAWRANWLGWTAVYTPAARVHHVHSGTGVEGSAFKTYWLARNKISLLAKNYPFRTGWRYLPLLLLYEVLSLGYALLGGQGVSALRGRWAGLRALPQAWRRRLAEQGRARVSASLILQRLQPAAWPWQVTARVQHLRRQPASGAPAA